MRHHYIPCFYTGRWVGNDKRLCQYSRPHTTVKPKRVYPAATGYEDDLWAIPLVPEDKKQLIETRFMLNIDQKASDALSKIENDNIKFLTQEERIFWATFLVSLTQRNPEQVSTLKSDSLRIIDNILLKLRDTYQSQRHSDDPSTFDEWLQITTETGYFERAKVLMLHGAILIPETTKFIANLHCGICSFNANSHRLLTSDRPVIMSNGLAYLYGHIALPIGPRKLFLASRTPELAREICGRRGLAETTNYLIARQAHKYVYGTDDTQLRFVENRLRKKVG
jgi:hypothetical protein